jgi:hypothetical protein
LEICLCRKLAGETCTRHFAYIALLAWDVLEPVLPWDPRGAVSAMSKSIRGSLFVRQVRQVHQSGADSRSLAGRKQWRWLGRRAWSYQTDQPRYQDPLMRCPWLLLPPPPPLIFASSPADLYTGAASSATHSFKTVLAVHQCLHLVLVSF